MTHYGSLGTQPVSNQVRDIRGTTVRGSDGEQLGTVQDVIFDHDTMEIRYLVIDSRGWLTTGTFLLPADIVLADEDHKDGLATEATKEQIEDSPQYDKASLSSNDEWKRYEQEFKKYWEDGAVMHRKDSPDRILTPPAEELLSGGPSSKRQESRGPVDDEVDVARLFPERMTPVFTDPRPSGGKVTLRPKSVARAEEAATGVNLLKPRWWEAFENYLRINKKDINAKCEQCESDAKSKRNVA